MEVESGAEQTQTLVIGAAIAGLALVRGDGHFHDSIPPHYLGALNHICTGRRERLIGGGVGGWGCKLLRSRPRTSQKLLQIYQNFSEPLRTHSAFSFCLGAQLVLIKQR